MRFLTINGIDIKDLKFFIPFGAVAAILMQLTSYLPERINRGIFSDMIYDHIPFTTVMVMFLLQASIVFFYHSINNRKVKKYLRSFAFHASKKIGHFASPAMSIFIGLTIAAAIWAILPFTKLHLSVSLIFIWASFYFLLLSGFSRLMVSSIRHIRSNTLREIMKYIGLAGLFALLIMPFMNNEPINVSFSLSVDKYDQLYKMAETSETTVNFMAKSIITNSLDQ